MAFDTLKLIKLSIRFGLPLVFQLITEKITATIHAYTYKSVPNPKNVVVIGGSFAGIELCRKLMHSLPTGYQVVLIEKNSHFNYTFNFPRYSVLRGHDKLAFIPYDGIEAPALRWVRGRAVTVDKSYVQVEGGEGKESISYTYLVIATGSSQSAPARLKAVDRDEACAELRGMQASIFEAEKIAVVGAGAVGVELAADIKSYYPKKNVTLVHSRNQLLSRFGRRLHDYVFAELVELGVEVKLGVRPKVLEGMKGLEFDLVIPCTGQRSNTSILEELAPNTISKSTGRILVEPTLQISGNAFQRIFAIGDVAETGGPKMARAAFFQVLVVKDNILSLIDGKKAGVVYQPNPSIEGALKLTLGKTEVVLYTQLDSGDEILVTSSKGNDDLDVKRAWKMYGADSAKLGMGK